MTSGYVSAVIREQLDRIVETAHRMFADVFELEIAFDEVGERAALASGSVGGGATPWNPDLR